MGTLVLTRSEVEACLDPPALLAALRAAFAGRAMAPADEARRVPLALPAPAPAGASGMLLAPGLVPGLPGWTAKVHAKTPGGAPAIRGVLVLNDLRTGAPLAVMDSVALTARRTALAAALGADALARDGARRLLLVGAGAQGRAQLGALRLVRRIEEVRVLDPDPAALALLREEPAAADVAITPVRSLDEGVEGADIVVTATWVREPFLFRRHLRPGVHITTLGPDQPGKCEVAAEALEAARVVVDDRSLAVEMGAVGGAGLGAEAIWADLGEVLAGKRPGREAEADVTVFGAVGLPFQDLAAAWLAYETARSRGVGRWIDLLA